MIDKMEKAQNEENKEIRKVKAKPLIEQIRELREEQQKLLNEGVKTKKLKLPRKARVARRKLKKGYIGVLRIDENRNITAEKQRIYGSSFKDGSGFYHATDGREILFWEGKFPIVIQPTWKLNPLKFDPNNDTNETYGQPYIQAKMLRNLIKVKEKMKGSAIIWIILIGAALFGINYLMGGKAF